MNKTQNRNNNLYDLHENKLSDNSTAFIKLLTKRGLLADKAISDERVRQAEMIKKRNMYHNTILLLKNYRNIVWALKCFPNALAEELNVELLDLDILLKTVSEQLDLDNERLESRFRSVQKSRFLLERVNESLSLLKQRPGNGAQLYEIIYHTYLGPDVLAHYELLQKLKVSTRHYYRLRQQAINILSIHLWSAPSGELDSWLETLTLLQSLAQ